MFLGHVALLKAQYHHPMEVSEDDVMSLDCVVEWFEIRLTSIFFCCCNE
jgi:hypothetical protein